jgi:hypothetical protein
MDNEKIILYTSFYRDGDNEYREPCVEVVHSEDGFEGFCLTTWAEEQEEQFGERDEDGFVWDGNRIYEVHDPKEITEEERALLSKIGIC